MMDKDNNVFSGEVTRAGPSRQELIEAKECAEHIVDSVHEPMVVLTAKLTVKSVNDAFYRHFQVSPEETCGRRIYELGNGQWDIPALRELLEDVLPARKVFDDYEVRHDFEEIGPRVLLLNARQLDHVQLILLGIQDITDAAQAQETLRESEQRFRGIFDNAPMGIAITDWQGHFEQCNPAYCAMVGYTQEELRRMEFTSLVHPDDRHANLAQVRRLQDGGLPFFELENRYICRSGRMVWVHKFVSTLPNTAGRPAHLLALVTDITERKRDEETRRQFNAMLESKVAERTAELEYRTGQLQRLVWALSQAENRERKRVAAILHEDLQQQMAGAKFHLGALSGRAGQDPAQEAIVAGVIETLRKAIEQSRRLSYELSPAVLHWNDLMESLGWLAGQMQARSGLTVEIQADEEVLVDSETVAVFLFRAAEELLSNVVKHAGVGEAKVRARRIGRCIGLTVSDRGRGFEPRGLVETKGVGLFSIRERVELLGGRMKIRSTPGQGSRLLIAVPEGQRTASTPPDAELAPRGPSRSEGSGCPAEEGAQWHHPRRGRR